MEHGRQRKQAARGPLGTPEGQMVRRRSFFLVIPASVFYLEAPGTRQVLAVSVSPNGKLLVLGGEDPTFDALPNSMRLRVKRRRGQLVTVRALA